MPKSIRKSKKKEAQTWIAPEVTSLVRSLQDIGGVVDAKGRYAAVSPAFARLLKHPVSKIIGKKDSGFLPRTIASAFSKAEQEARRTKSAVHLEFSHGPYGGRRDFRVRLIPLFHTDGTFEGVFWSGSDVTDRRRIAEAMGDAEKKYRTFFEKAHDAIFIADAKTGRIVDANQSAAKLLGRPLRDVIGMPHSELHPIKDAARYEKLFREHIRVGSADALEAEVLRSDGAIVPVHISAKVLELRGRKLIQGIFKDVSELHRGIDALKASGRKFRAIVDQAGDAFFLHDLEGRILDTNAQACKSLGYTRREILRLGVSDIEGKAIAADARQLRAFHEKIPLGKAIPFEGVHRRKDGSTFPVEVSLCRISIDGDEFITALARDISGRKRVEAAMKLHSAVLTHMQEGANLVRVDDEKIVYTNPRFDEMFGYGEGELLGQHVSILNAPGENPDDISDQVEAGLKKEGAWVGEVKNIRKDGTPFVSRVSISMFEHPDFGPVGISVHSDITERRRMEDALRDSEEKFKDLAEHLPNMVFINQRGRVVFANRKCEEVMGYSREEFYAPDFDFMGLIEPEHHAMIQANIVKHQKGAEVPPCEYTLRTRDGRLLHAIHTTKLVNFDGAPAILGIVTDVTERVSMEAERAAHLERERALRRAAEEASQSKDEFLALLSHELRTPMTAMMGWMWLLRSKDMGADEAADAMSTIERNMNQQAQIIEDLLDISRIVTGKMRLEPRITELAPILGAALDVVRPMAGARSIRLSVPSRFLALKVLGDPERLQQVFWNLLTNAIKFTPSGGRVRVGLRKKDGRVQVSVKDDGPGLDPAFLDHIFDPFTQEEKPLTRDHGGLGLGLAIVHQIVELHGGTVAAKSAGLGKGAEFIVSFPVSKGKLGEDEKGRIRPSRERVESSLERLDGVRVLVVDDDADTRTMLRSTLELCGADVRTAPSAAEGFKQFRKGRVDVLLLDLAMPGEDGYSLIKRVRNLGHRKGGDTPAAALTAMTRAEDRTKVLRSGFNMYLPKPIEPAELAAVVRGLADRRV